MVSEGTLNTSALLNAMGQAMLIFDDQGSLVNENRAAEALLGADLKLIRARGWAAASALFDAHLNEEDRRADDAVATARDSGQPERFHIFRAGEYLPCWASLMAGDDGHARTLITIEQADWAALTDMLTRFRSEVETAAAATQGHTSLILQSLKVQKKNETLEQLGRRISGFVQLIATHSHRVERLMGLFYRLENIRTGQLSVTLPAELRKIHLADFMEDFMESLDEITLIDPESEAHDYRARITISIPDDLVIFASPDRVSAVLHDVLRNAIMYSMKATPVMIMARASDQQQSAQIDVVDEGYGIRAREFERVFALFERARQPQIIGEFGYGLSLYLCKHEIEAMNGKIWFQSEEGVGTTFSVKLPLWRATDVSSSSSAST